MARETSNDEDIFIMPRTEGMFWSKIRLCTNYL
jgi:hypothetical protein